MRQDSGPFIIELKINKIIIIIIETQTDFFWKKKRTDSKVTMNEINKK